ncbi:MAG: toxin-antitoxin system HicB family antitoxin [Leptolyngbya sp. SIO3F4]|nr:toxin-antitoxin system HicB family antitoxin [Leptolyngbya sp. SIO3F4]
MKSALLQKPPRQNLTIRMTPELKQRAQISAIQQKRSLSDLIEEALETLLSRQERAA